MYYYLYGCECVNRWYCGQRSYKRSYETKLVGSLPATQPDGLSQTTPQVYIPKEFYFNLEITNRVFDNSLLDPNSLNYKTLQSEINNLVRGNDSLLPAGCRILIPECVNWLNGVAERAHSCIQIWVQFYMCVMQMFMWCMCRLMYVIHEVRNEGCNCIVKSVSINVS